jgi:hypothetical protein
MPRLAAAAVAALTLAAAARADAFDTYTNADLARALDAGGGPLTEVKELGVAQIAEHDAAIPGVSGTVLVVRTADGRNAKLLVQSAGRKAEGGEIVPMLLVVKYTTFREGGDRVIQASGQNLNLFPGFRLHLGFGQVVPEPLGGDLLVEPAGAGGRFVVKPVGKAKLYVATKPLATAAAGKAAKGPTGKFGPEWFAGTYKLQDDGRRSGVLTLALGENGEVTGTYVSDRDGRPYEVKGRLGPARHAVTFVVKLPMVEETFTGWLFTGDGKAIAGTSKLLEREAGFYAVRVEE